MCWIFETEFSEDSKRDDRNLETPRMFRYEVGIFS